MSPSILRAAPRCARLGPVRRSHSPSTSQLLSGASLPCFVPNRPHAAPSSSGVTVCRFPTGSGQHAPGDSAMQRCRRQWLGVAMNVYARPRLSQGPPPPQSASASRQPSAGRRLSPSDSPLLPAPPRLPHSSAVLHVSVLSNKRRVSRLAPLRNRARRRVTAALMAALSVGAKGGLDVWIDTTLASGLVSSRWLWDEAAEAMRAVGALQPNRSASPSASTVWRQRLTAMVASRESVAGTSQPTPQLPARSAVSHPPQVMSVSMQLAIALFSHSSPTLPGAAMLSRLAHLCSSILQPPATVLSRHNSPFLPLQPYTSRHHKHVQRRQLRQCIAAGAASATAGRPMLGVRQVEECLRWLSEMEGEGRQEVAAVLCEARVWLAHMLQVHSDGRWADGGTVAAAQR